MLSQQRVQSLPSEVMLDLVFFPPLRVPECWQMKKEVLLRGFWDVRGWLEAGRARVKVLWGAFGLWGAGELRDEHGARGRAVTSPLPGGLCAPQASSQAASSSRKLL